MYKYMNEMQTEYCLPKGTLLFNGKYRIEAYLASGGFGNTYLATDTSFNEQVAIKELFVKGICGRNASTGKARLVFESGDTYEGTFVQGFYDKGRYTLADGSYFEGTFKEGTPSDGKWYNADGSFSATVVNGVEQ